MANKRIADLRSKVYSFSEDDDDTVQRQPIIRQKRNAQNDTRKSCPRKTKNLTRLENISPSCVDERFANVSNRNGNSAMSQYSDKNRSGFSRNAILARENRIKKKMYIIDLESQVASLKTENKKIRTTIGTQSNYITDLEKEINYLKSVLANTKEIGLLLRSVHANTGLPVTTSMKHRWGNDGDLKENNIPASSPKSVEPWKPVCNKNEAVKISNNRHIPTPPASVSSMSPHHQYSPIYEPSSPLNLDVTSYLSDEDFSLCDLSLPQFSSIEDDVFSMLSPETSIPAAVESTVHCLNENANDHTYSSPLNMLPDFNPVNAGVCFHICNRKISLEFCAKCNEKAVSNWETAMP